MSKKPWTVAVISTDYDLEDERKAVISFLQNHGINDSAFEEPGFPVQEGEPSHENCIKALRRADLAILIIKERYGGRYILNKDISVTEAEYNKLSIPTIVLVHKKTWDERAFFRRQQKHSGLDEAEFVKQKKYAAGKIDIEVLLFVNRIQNIYDTSGRSNWINFWNDIEDLKKALPALMSSRSSAIIHEILNKQIEEVRNRRTSTGLSMPLGDVFDRELYIEPVCNLIAGSLANTDSLTNDVCQKLKNNESCLLIGEAGAGKTTLLAKCFLNMATTDDPFFIPAYVRLKGMNKSNIFSVEEYLQKCCEHYLHREPYPFFNIQDFRFVFFLDGFDELAEELSKEELKKIYASEMFAWPLMLTSRQQYAERYISSNEFASKFGCCIKLEDWDKDVAIKYINLFCDKQKKDVAYKERIMYLLVDNDELQDVLKTPLLITILLYVIERSRMEIPETIGSRTQLFEECLDSLAAREIEKKNIPMDYIPSNSELVNYWAYFAWMIYENRLKGEKRIRVSDAVSHINDIFNTNAILWPSTIYEVIFDIGGEYAFGAIHEQFLEYLVAYSLAYACLKRIAPYPDFLKYIMRPEINRYFRGIVNRKPEQERKTIVDNLEGLYWKYVGKTKNDDILTRVHAVYHLSRLIPRDNSDVIDRIFVSEKEQTVLQSLYFGVIKKGDLCREKELYNLLSSDQKYSNSNRGYHLAYYDLASSQITVPYSDDISVSWDGSLHAFMRHFSSLDTEHYYLRRIDLITMRQFMEFRGKCEPLTDEILDKFSKWVIMFPHGANQVYQKMVEEEFQRLKETYVKLS